MGLVIVQRVVLKIQTCQKHVVKAPLGIDSLSSLMW